MKSKEQQVIDAARDAMNDSRENGDGDIVIASHLAASLSLCLDVLDAQQPAVQALANKGAT